MLTTTVMSKKKFEKKRPWNWQLVKSYDIPNPTMEFI
jgi:hypothetical protein